MDNQLQIVLAIKDQATDTLKKFSGGFTNATKNMSDSMKNLGTNMALIGAAPTAALVYSTKRAAEFETQMSNISTLIAGDSTDAMKTLSKETLNLAKTMPKSIDELGGSLYDILSAGITNTADQMKVLESSTKLAVAGLGNTKGATDIMTSAINAFGLEASDAGEIADILFKTVKNGKTTVDQMSQAFGATAPIIAAAEISLEEYSAATAALTTTGQPASQAQNSLRQATVALMKPTKEMKELLTAYGYESGEAALKQDGLVAVMRGVTEQGNNNAEVLGKAWGSVEALGAATALTDQVSQSFVNTLADMTKGSNAVEEAFNKQKSTFESQMSLMKNQTDALTISIGRSLLPTLNKLIERLIPLVDKFAQFADEHPRIISGILLIGAGIGALGAVMYIFGTAIGILTSAFTLLLPFVTFVGAGIAAISAPVWITIAAITALIAIGVLLWKNWDTIVEKATLAWDLIKLKTSEVWESIVLYFSQLPERIGAFFTDLFTVRIPFAIGFMIGWLTVKIPEILNNIVLWFSQLPEKVWAIFDLVKTWVMVALEELWTWISTEVPTWPTRFYNFIKSIPTKVSEVFEEAKKWAIEKMEAMYSGVSKIWDKLKSIFDGIKNKANEAWEATKKSFDAGKNAGMQGYATGGWVNQTGPAIVHKGEYVLSRDMLRGRTPAAVSPQNNFNSPVNIYATINNDMDINNLGYVLAWNLRNSG